MCPSEEVRFEGSQVVPADFARELERENAKLLAANAELITVGAELSATADELRAENAELLAENNRLTQQLHALRLVCGTTDANKFQTRLDRALAEVEEQARLLGMSGERESKMLADNVALRDALNAQLSYQRELRADRDRLDWLDSCGDVCSDLTGKCNWKEWLVSTINSSMKLDASIRSAIDSEMKLTKEENEN